MSRGSEAISASIAGQLADFLLPPACAGCGGYLLPPRRVVAHAVVARPAVARPGLARSAESRPRMCPECRTRLRAPAHPRCPRCHAPRGTGVGSDRPCAGCHEWPPVLQAARSAVVLRPPADAIVHALKYGGWPELGAELAEWMVGLVRAEPKLLGGRPVVPVPSTQRRLRARGYDQARMLADKLAQETGGTLVDALARREGGESQVALHPGERLANVCGAFFLSSRESSEAIRGRDVLLVDDVLTTGATAGAAAEALGRGGAKTCGHPDVCPGHSRIGCSASDENEIDEQGDG